MRSTFTRIPATLAVACAIALGVFSANASAQVRDINETALLLDTRGAPVMSSSGLCWHTGYGPAPLWTAGCHAERPVPADVLFDSNKSVLRPADRDTLDAFVSKGVPADRVKTRAWGETRPSTAAAECKDANNRKNVTCMQPDRHVSIEISGTRLAK